MRKLLAFAVLMIACSADAAPASQESVEQLLAATRTESMMETIYGSLEQTMRQSMKKAVEGKPVSEQQQRFLDAVPAKFVAVMRDELNWAKLKPLYVQVYRETFEQDEIDGLIAFYTSPAGQAFVNKMPVVMQKSIVVTQAAMQSLAPRMSAAVKEALAEAKVPR